MLGWGGNVDASFIVDRGMAYRYMVKYASKGESRSRDAQKLLTTLLNDASEQAIDERLSMPRMLQSAMMRCPTRRDMGAQEVHHLNFQAKSVDHNMSFARASTQKDSVELQRGPGGRREIRRDTLTACGERLDAQTWPSRTILVNDALRDMPRADFVMDFYVGRNGLITRCRGGLLGIGS